MAANIDCPRNDHEIVINAFEDVNTFDPFLFSGFTNIKSTVYPIDFDDRLLQKSVKFDFPLRKKSQLINNKIYSQIVNFVNKISPDQIDYEFVEEGCLHLKFLKNDLLFHVNFYLEDYLDDDPVMYLTINRENTLTTYVDNLSEIEYKILNSYSNQYIKD